MIKLAERCEDCARSKENPGTGFTAERASKFRSAKCQSLYFGPPW